MLHRVKSTFCRIFLSHSAKKFQGEPFCAVSEIYFGSERVCIKEGGEYQGFPSKNCCPTLPKTFAWEPFRVSLVLSFEKLYASE